MSYWRTLFAWSFRVLAYLLSREMGYAFFVCPDWKLFTIMEVGQ